MRKSLTDIKHMLREKPYPGKLPEELKPYHVYLVDSGHNIMCVLEKHLQEKELVDYDDYEVPVPVKYVIEKSYRFQDGYVVVDAEYSSEIGLMVHFKYSEF